MNEENYKSEEPKCPMGKNPWLATFVLVIFCLILLAKKLGFM